MTTKMMKPFKVFAPITRVDEAERIVEGYCYVNAIVGDGINLTRKSMMKASDDYMKWGAIRAMHQPVAAGNAEAVVWDDRGALLRAKITDDAEWAKCLNGTYKGFSVGVNPEVMRGNETVKVKWVENSLVDRPFDEDAKFTVVRAEGVAENYLDTEVEVTILDDVEVTRSDEPETETEPTPAILRTAITELDGTLEALETAGVDVPVAEVAILRVKLKKISKMAKKLSKVQTALFGNRSASGTIERNAEAEPVTPAIDPELVKRLDMIERASTATLQSLADTRKELKAEKKRRKALERSTTATTNRPVQFPGVERTFAANELLTGETSSSIDEMKAEYDKLTESVPKEEDGNARIQGAIRIGVLQSALAEHGIEVN